ncbi:MAG: T9SS type A sorting domain-containing protein [Bacteroidota bacterium]
MKTKITLLLLFITFQINAQCWQSISSGIQHTLGIKTDGTLWAWGKNDTGQLGMGDITIRTVPTQVGTASDWKFINSGYGSSFAIKTDGTLWAWGNNEFGKIGDGTQTNKLSPIQIGTDTNWVSVDSKNHTVAIKTDGTLWTWGVNSSGEMGDGTQSGSVYRLVPGQVGTETDWKDANAGANYTIALKANGTIWAWGHGSAGSLGNGGYGNSYVPVLSGFDEDWEKISTGNGHTLAIKTDGTLWAWGQRNYGQVGNGTYSATTGINAPVQIGIAKGWANVSAGTSHSLAVKENGTLWAWGNNSSRQLGDGTTVSYRSAPVQIGTDTNWAQGFSRGQTSVVLKTDGSLSAWGFNGSGQLGDGSMTNRNAPVAIACPVTLSTEEFSAATFSVHPNPTTGLLNINNKMNLSIDTVSIIDLTRKKVLEQKGGNTQIDVQQLENGIYIMKITSEEKSYLGKFIKM